MGPVIEASKLHKTYQSRDPSSGAPALRGVDLVAHAGELLSIVGPSGSGKSTLLYCLSGLEPVDHGTVRVLGVDLASASAREIALLRRKAIGFVFQSFHLVPSFTAIDNVALPLMLSRDRDSRQAARAALGMVRMTEFATRLPRRLSGGQQQRVALARVFAQRPKVVFADEPTGALDRATGRQVLDSLQALTARGTCVVLVTHDVDAAARADRALVLVDGAIAEEIPRPTPTAILRATRAPATSAGR